MQPAATPHLPMVCCRASLKSFSYDYEGAAVVLRMAAWEDAFAANRVQIFQTAGKIFTILRPNFLEDEAELERIQRDPACDTHGAWNEIGHVV